MRYLKYIALLGILAFVAVASASAQVRVAVGPYYGGPYNKGYSAYYDDHGYGSPPEFAYGYYEYFPYARAPFRFLGPGFFVDGAVVGGGPWWGWGRGVHGRGFVS